MYARMRTHKADIFRDWLCAQLSKERVGNFQVDSVKALCKPIIDGLKEITGFDTPPVVARQPSEIGGSAQLKHLPDYP
jgi:hypothetical protein